MTTFDFMKRLMPVFSICLPDSNFFFNFNTSFFAEKYMSGLYKIVSPSRMEWGIIQTQQVHGITSIFSIFDQSHIYYTNLGRS